MNKATCSIGGALTSPEIPIAAPPTTLDWNLWQGYKNRPLVDHFRNFIEAARDKKEPISDVFSHHRALSTCHLAGIAARLNRKITWDPQKEMIVGDAQAQGFVSREYRNGYEIG